MPISFRDFEPRQTSGGGFFQAAEYEDIQLVIDDMNAWIADRLIDVVNIETVVLPNIHRGHEEGTTDPSLRISGESSSTWHQFFRVWFRDS